MPCILQSVLCLSPGPLRPFAAAMAALSPSDRAALGAIEVAVFEGRLGPGWSRIPIRIECMSSRDTQCITPVVFSPIFNFMTVF